MTKHQSLTPTFRLLAAPGLVAAGLLAAPAITSADEPAITCGTVVTSDVRLRADLLDCAGPGLVVGASGVTIDLGGHLIDGAGTANGIDAGGYDDVRITNGTVRQFRFGVALSETSGVRLSRLTVESNLIGVNAIRVADIELDRVTADASVSNGIEITFSDGVAVRRSTATGNGFGGIVVRFSDGSTILERNSTTGNDSSGLIIDGSTGVRVERNQADSNGFDGIELVSVEDAVVDRNEAAGNAEHGISVDQPGNVVSRNRTFDNGGFGISAPDGTIDGGGNRAAGNLAGACTGVACR